MMRTHHTSALVNEERGQRIIFTGPDGIGDYRPRLGDFHHSVGIGALSPEATKDLNYLFRAAPCAPPLLSKNFYVGGVGWGIHHGYTLNANSLLSNKQIKLSEIRSALEDLITHSYPNQCQPSPDILDRQTVRSHGKLAWNQGAYEIIHQDKSKQCLLKKRREAQTKKAERKNMSAFTLPAIARVNI
ncbi:protein SPMIP2 [Trichomycterus rosablanca]|uniref:protein SPMIP2 n=1 Tax=Trichomycterus rosablanca TaxID=2290929 RepID=UPI002F3566AC